MVISKNDRDPRCRHGEPNLGTDAVAARHWLSVGHKMALSSRITESDVAFRKAEALAGVQASERRKRAGQMRVRGRAKLAERDLEHASRLADPDAFLGELRFPIP